MPPRPMTRSSRRPPSDVPLRSSSPEPCARGASGAIDVGRSAGVAGGVVGSPHGENALRHDGHATAVASALAGTAAPQSGQWTVVVGSATGAILTGFMGAVISTGVPERPPARAERESAAAGPGYAMPAVPCADVGRARELNVSFNQ